MYVSSKDPLNSVHDWFQARTYQATRPQDWTAEADLYLDYQRHAEAAGIRPSKRVGKTAFATELRGLMRREPQLRLARLATAPRCDERHLPFWPRHLRNARQLAAA
jgi:hypothetical protein